MMGNKKGITLLALVITIVIILLLAGITLQMSMGENGLIAKSEQAKKEQAKAELYDTVKSSYAALSLRAIRNDKDKPNVEEVFNTADFTDRYNIVGDNITDKKGTVIDTKENVVNMLKLLNVSSTTETPAVGTSPSGNKIVGGVEIPDEDKDKLIMRVKVLGEKETIQLYSGQYNSKLLQINFGNGTETEMTSLYTGKEVEYNKGEYIIKIGGFDLEQSFGLTMMSKKISDYSVEILQWGRISNNEDGALLEIDNISEIYEPEPDNLYVKYKNAKFSRIPEWLFSKKVKGKKVSEFYYCRNLTNIPENLFENYISAEDFTNLFVGCTGLTNIPENLFKHTTNATNFRTAFGGCTGLTSIPEKLFKYTPNATNFGNTFGGCTGLTSIPEGLFKNNVNVTGFWETFDGCIGLTSIPEGLFKNNVNVTEFWETFSGCTGLISIPENLFKYTPNVQRFWHTFEGCKGLTSIPQNLFKYNPNVEIFQSTFELCENITSIPEDIFKYNVNVKDFSSMFNRCTRISNIPDRLFFYNFKAKKFYGTFAGCSGLIEIPENIFNYENNSVQVVHSMFSRCINLRNVPEKLIQFGKTVYSNIGMFSECKSIPNYRERLGILYH